MDLENPSYFSVSVEKPSPSPNFRTFGRSISANSYDSKDFLRGEPRLSDLAPDIAAKRINARNARIREADATPEPNPDQVFLVDENSARYYNVPAPATSERRRHSVGSSFSSRDRTTSLSLSLRSFKGDDEQERQDKTIREDASPPPEIDDHSIRHGSYPRRRCTRCVKGANLSKRGNMDDILMVSLKSSQAASLWVDYFTSYFQQIGKQTNRKSFKIHQLAVEDFMQSTTVDGHLLIEKSSCVKLQLVVLCPLLMEYLTEHAENSNFGKLFLSDRTLALQLGVSDNDLTETHRKILPNYFKWQRMCVGQDQDENFTKEFIGHAMTILTKVWKQQSSVTAQEKSCFSVSPKKIRQGQSSVFILLSYPLQKEDAIKICVEKNNEMIEVKNVKRRNPYTIKISVPDNFTDVTAIINVVVEKNGSIIGSRPVKCESRLRELEQILRQSDNPVEFMCQTLGFASDRDHLDNWLVHNFQKNVPPHFNLLANHHGPTPYAASIQAHKHSHEEYPTLLHFAARFGLEKLALQLMECPGADLAFEIKNLYDLTPAEVAEQNDHSELAASLRNYMNMHEFSNMYAKLKAISTYNPEQNLYVEPEYLVPRSLEDCYKVCPAPRPVVLPKKSTPFLSASTSTTDLMSPSGYTPMYTPLPKHSEKRLEEDLKMCTLSKKPETRKYDEKTGAIPKNIEVYEDKVQKELVEIINDFKNNVHSISQVEKLVEEWKNRNDVQKSFREKQEQLKEMRQKYEKIQHEMKLALKKPTPFERVKKLLFRSKTRDDSSDISSPIGLVDGTNANHISSGFGQRPVSSLSTSSSGSSGRMSTISGCSLGDSGTHSDNEDRKNILRTMSGDDDDFRHELNRVIMNLHYTPLPSPKPIKCVNQLKTKLTTTIEETTQKPDQQEPSTNDQYYIQFPPSGLPVINEPTRKTDNASENYMNVAAKPANPTHDYMNFRQTSTGIK